MTQPTRPATTDTTTPATDETQARPDDSVQPAAVAPELPPSLRTPDALVALLKKAALARPK